MADILDTNNDFSSLADALNLAVPTGAEAFFLTGQSLAKVNFDWVQLRNRGTVVGTPYISGAGIVTTSTDYVTIPGGDLQSDPGSETFFVVCHLNSSDTPTVGFNIYNDLNGGSFNIGTTMSHGQNGQGGFWAAVGLILSGGAASNVSTKIGANNALTWAASNTFTCYAVTIDMSNMLLTVEVLSKQNWINAGWSSNSLTASIAIPAGATRPANTNARVIGKSSGANGSVGTIYALVKYGVALTLAQRQAVYNQLAIIMNKRGVNLA